MRRVRSVGFAVAGAALALWGCAGGPAPLDHYYRLTPVPGPAALPAPALDGTLEVSRFRAEALASDRPILYRDDASSPEVKRYAYHRWADSPPLLLQRATVDYLRGANAAPTVVTPADRVDAGYRLTGRVVQLERVLGPGGDRVVVAIEFALVPSGGGALRLQREYRAERPAGGDVAASVAAMNEALGEILGRLVADLRS